MVYGVLFTTACVKVFAVWDADGTFVSSMEMVVHVDGAIGSCVAARMLASDYYIV
jgi:hypothetical protein